jgi:hypothetical protein
MRMLEIESLGPLISLHHKQTVEHVESWELHDGPAVLDSSDPEAQLDKFLEPILKSHV